MNIEAKGKLLCINKKYHLVYCAGNLYVFANKSTARIISYPLFDKMRGRLAKFRLSERLLRLEARCAISLSDDVFLVSCGGKILRVDVSTKQVAVEHQFVSDMNNLLSFCVCDCNDRTEVLYGEYGWNTEKHAVGIWRRMNNSWEKIASFPENSITHIHQIVFDKYRNEFLIATGDKDNESGIWRMDTQYKNIEPILYGSQQYRTCAVFPTKKGFIFATDTPIAKNYLYSYSYQDDSLTEVAHMPGPCIYATNRGDEYFFATSVEPDSNLSTWRYRLTYRLGSGILDRYTHIIRYINGALEEVIKFKKDCFPIWLFQFGNCQFPMVQDGTDTLYVTPTAVHLYDNKTIRM